MSERKKKAVGNRLISVGGEAKDEDRKVGEGNEISDGLAARLRQTL